MPTASPVRYRTADGVDIFARHWAAAPAAARDCGLVLAHGFTGSSANPAVQRICGQLAAQGFGVLSPDFRGHGRSGGATTAGELEVLDVAAAVDWLRGMGYQHVAVVGFSMGASAVIRYAGLPGADAAVRADKALSAEYDWACTADAVVSVSSPGMWYERGTRPMRRVHWVLEKQLGRALLRLTRNVKVAGGTWDPIPAAPYEVVGSIAAPLLLIHGAVDHYLPLRHVEALAGAATGGTRVTRATETNSKVEVWVEPGMAHAESSTSQELVTRMGTWLRAVLDEPVGEALDEPAR